MTLPVSGAISFNNINVELGVSGTTQASLGQASYRTLAGVASGAISMSNFYGKANQFAFTISSNQTNANLATLATAAGWNGSSQLIATIGSGVYISATSTADTALTISGSFPGGVSLVNNGYIVGMGGNGGQGARRQSGTNYASVSGSAGGKALAVSSSVTITNNGTIGGGGGGGGGGGMGLASDDYSFSCFAGGSGGGGGRTGTTNSSGGGGGTVDAGTARANGNTGSAGTSSSQGGGGSGVGAGYAGYIAYGGAGGSGGSWGSSGATGSTGSANSYSKTGVWTPGASGGGAGACLTGNSYITWAATGTRLGSIS